MQFFITLLSTLSTIALAHDVRQHGRQLDGEARAQIGVDTADGQVGPQAPVMGFLSVECPAASEAESAQLQRAISVVGNYSWIQFPTTAKCVRQNHKVNVEGFASDASDYQGCGHHHAGSNVLLEYRYQDVAKLTNVRLNLGSQFPSLRRTIVETATAQGQIRVELRGQQQQVELPW